MSAYFVGIDVGHVVAFLAGAAFQFALAFGIVEYKDWKSDRKWEKRADADPQ